MNKSHFLNLLLALGLTISFDFYSMESTVGVGQVVLAANSAVFHDSLAQPEVFVGTTIPLTGGVSLIGQDVLWGITLVFNKTNAAGLLKGKVLKLESRDNANDPVMAVSAFQELSKISKILLCPFCTEVDGELSEFISKNSSAVFFPISGGKQIRSGTVGKVFHLRAGLKSEVFALVNYCNNVLKRHKVAVFYEDSAWGEEALSYAKEAFALYKVDAKGFESYPINTVEIANAVTNICKAGPNAVLCLAQARPMYNFISQGLRRGLKNCKFFGLGECVPSQDILGSARGLDLITTSVVPSPFKSELAIAKQYRADMAKFYANKSFSQFFFEGYLAASILVMIFKSIEARVSLESFISAAESIKNYNFEGFALDFDQKTRSLNKTVWINIGREVDWPAYVFNF